MPRYVCDECGEVFQSKENLRNHTHDTNSSTLPSLQFKIPDLSLRQMAVLGGVFLMATLFMGTVFYASSVGPSSPSGSGSSPRGEEPSPPVGYTIQTQSDIPSVPESSIPSSGISKTQLSQDVQLYLLTRPAVLLQYSCTDCPETVENLEDLASEYNTEQTWVYVAPYRDTDSRIAATAFQSSREMESFDRSRLESFICNSLQERPVRCALR